MRARRRMRLCGALAASRFMTHRGRAAGGWWLPLSLRWRARRAAQRGARIERVSPAATHVSWFPQFHLHFQSHVSREHRPGVLVVQPQWTRETVLERRSTGVRSTTLRTEWRRDSLFHTRSTSLATRTLPRLRHSESQTMLRSIVTHVASHSARTETLPRFETRSARHSILDRQERTHSRELTVLRQRQRNLVTRNVEMQRAQATPPAPLLRGPELIWRRDAQPRPEAAHPHAGVQTQVSPPRSFASRAEEPPETRTAAERQSLKTATHDPALMDRLAEDVIRRVERRARIERERRGLA